MQPIEKDRPVPEVRVPAKDRYPIRLLGVGESFWVPDAEKSRIRQLLVLEKAWRGMGHIPGWNYTTRQEGAGMRVWRVA